jgi:hypothetical protein
MTALPAGVCALDQQRLLGVVSEPLGVGAGVELVDGTGQSVLGLLDLVLNLLGGALGRCGLLQSSVSQNLVLAVPACTLISTLALKS